MDSMYLTIIQWMGQGVLLGALGCFLWGVVSVLFSPCHLASIPLLVSYVAGQDSKVSGFRGALFAILFTTGLFITIAAVGIVCALLGRMLGDVGPYLSIVVGVILLWVSFDILGVVKCSMQNNILSRLRVSGLFGALILGLAYGILSGSCTFGFIAPILAVITVQEQFVTGVVFILLFGIGHCIPIAIAGSSTAMVNRILGSGSWANGSVVFRKLAGACIGLLGVYFIGEPVLSSM